MTHRAPSTLMSVNVRIGIFARVTIRTVPILDSLPRIGICAYQLASCWLFRCHAFVRNMVVTTHLVGREYHRRSTADAAWQGLGHQTPDLSQGK